MDEISLDLRVLSDTIRGVDCSQQQTPGMLTARVKQTGEVVTVQDYGKKFHPRYWTESAGYPAEELEFLGR